MNSAIVMISLVAVVVIVWASLSLIFWSLRNGISPMPTTDKVKQQILAALPRETEGSVIDLGSGWGHMAMQIAKTLPHCQVVGYESSPVPYLVSQLWHLLMPLPNLTFVRRDLFTQSLNNVALIYCYLYPEAMTRLVPKLSQEVNPGTVIISNTFALPKWEPTEVRHADDLYRTHIYIYSL